MVFDDDLVGQPSNGVVAAGAGEKPEPEAFEYLLEMDLAGAADLIHPERRRLRSRAHIIQMHSS